MLSQCNAMPTIAVKDLATAREFYEGKLGLSVQEEQLDVEVVIYRSGNGAVQVYTSATAGSNQSTYVTWEVPDIQVVVQQLKDKGVAFERYPDIPGVVMEGDVHVMANEKAAWFKDPDGNVLCLHGRA